MIVHLNGKKTRVLFLMESLNIGGAEKALVSLLNHMDYEKYDVTLKLISETGAFVKDARFIKGLEIESVLKPRNNKFCSIIDIIKSKLIYTAISPKIVGNYLCRGNYDVVVAFCEGYLTKWVASSSTQAKKIAWVHTDMVNNDWPVKTGVFKSLEDERIAYSRFDNVVAVSQTVAEGLKEKFGLKKVNVIYNIIDAKIVEKSENQTEISIPFSHSLNLVSIGRHEYIKGYDRLISAMKTLVKDEGLDVGLTLVGDGAQHDSLKRQIVENDLTANINLIGSTPNPYPYIRQADVFICPSREEGFNIALLEAMTLGVPVVATNSAGPSEILENGKYGLLVENSENGLISGVKSLFSNLNLFSDLKEKAIERALQLERQTDFNILFS